MYEPGGRYESEAEQQEAEEVNRKIEAELQQERRAEEKANNVKVLLLGAGEGGKSTILKQMKILHIQGFVTEEIKQYKMIIYSYLLDNMKAMLEIQPDLPLPDNLSKDKILILESFDKHRSRDIFTIEDELGSALQRMWDSQQLQGCIAAHNHVQLDDSVSYFYSSLARLLEPAYTPSVDDMIRVRVRTTGIVQVNFTIQEKKKKLSFQMYDVAGQRSERRKWIHCFEGVTAVLFVVSLAEYDQTLMEDSTCNRMVESLELFKSIVNNKFFTESSFILFLNKIDVFEEKIKKVVSGYDFFQTFNSGEIE